MQRRVVWIALVLAVALLLLPSLIPAVAQSLPPPPDDGCPSTPFVELNITSTTRQAWGQIPASATMLRVTLHNLQGSTGAFRNISIRRYQSSSTGSTSQGLWYWQWSSSNQFEPSWLDLATSTSSTLPWLRVSVGTAYTSGQIRVYACTPPVASTWGVVKSQSGNQSCGSPVLLTNGYDWSTSITLSQSGYILAARSYDGGDARTTMAVNTPGPYWWRNWLRVISLPQPDDAAVWGPLPAGSYQLSPSTPLDSVRVWRVECSSLVFPTFTPTPTPPATPTPTLPVLGATPLAASTPIVPTVVPVVFGSDPSQTQTVCRVIVPAVDLTVPDTSIGLQWDAVEVCTQNRQFSLSYNGNDLIQIASSALAVAAVWSIWTVIRRG